MESEFAETHNVRESKRAAARAALAQAALRLALDRGIDQVRVPDIAAAAGVSPRTFNNYFSSKEEAIAAIVVARASRIGQALRSRPEGEPLRESLMAVFADAYAQAERGTGAGGTGEAGGVDRLRLLFTSPALRGEYLKALLAVERALAAVIAERTGADAERDLRPRVLAAAVCGAERVAMTHWLRSGANGSLADVLRQAMESALAGVSDARGE